MTSAARKYWKEKPGMRSHRARFLSLTAVAALAAAVLAACGGSSSPASSSSGSPSSSASSSKGPILIGASLSLTGDFSADGQAFQRGYNLWVSDINSHGGLLGRQVKLIVLNDASSPTTVVSNYQKLIAVDHVNLTFGPFSSLLTGPASTTAARYGYAMIEGAGSSPDVFNVASNKAVHNVFCPSLPVADYMVPFANWVKSLPPGQQPKTAAYPMANDPFADPPVQSTQKVLSAAGIKTVYSKIFPAEVSAYKAPADQVAASGAQMVVLGSTDIPTVNAFIQAFEQQHYNPKIFIAASGPDQGAAFIKTVGKANATGMMVPNGWYGGYNNALSHIMVQQYIAKYGGSPSDINADVAEAYSVGEVAALAVKATGGTDNAKIIPYLHSGVTLATVQGPVKFNALGENPEAAAFIFQWQNGNYVQVLPLGSPGAVKIINPKPHWAS
jgi:branched-chain amino acid transport system substrate-binding protein